MTAAFVDLIIPDSGPLISLAHADRLDLIEVFDRPIVIADIVKLECLKKPTAPDYPVLERWFARIGNRVRVVDTPMREPYEAALQRERAGERRATSGFGDATLAYMLRRLDDFAAPGAVPLVLIEDEGASRLLSRFERAHILSTRTWLISLERAGVIPSARDVINKIAHGGRELSELQADRPGVGDDGKSAWLGQVVGRDGSTAASEKDQA
ncbi:hypothetical protein [Sphingomonas lenta]|uniref:DUF3368 domain-containing protein n=1 Tax=Sphingomonas lenta TaxID=1141887 RepID=A0A2A2SCR9_9SPHN|nr:hypothetical protein [Sphingomonas lenta]PAX07048.1 hypothetical protein CKY28_13430 [Sphingomonas lenta]